MERRSFIQKSLAGSALIASGHFPIYSMDGAELVKLTILHTNDVHSRIEPFPDDAGRNANLGGVARRAAMIDKIRAAEKNVLLVDAGDIFQGTPYFNMFGGELEIKLMSELGYDISTMGNHDFDAGIDGFEKQLIHANFPFVVSNYNFEDTILHDKVDKYRIFDFEGIKVGVIGAGIQLEGLVPQSLYKATQYLDPVSVCDKYAAHLKKNLDCQYVICLSHLGYRYDGSTVSDVILAQNTKHIDLIIGGHTHTFMRRGDRRRNLNGEEVVVTQAGWAGILLGHLEVYFEKSGKKRCVTCRNKWVG